jgi:uroporphyrinogen decarboxylase
VVEEESDLGRLKVPDPSRDGRIPVLVEAIKTILKSSQGRIVVCGRVASAFSGMLLLRGLERGLKDLYVNPNLCEELLKISHEVAETMARAQMEAGAHAIWVGDCLATSRLIPPRFHELYALPYQSKIISFIKKLEGIPILSTDEKKLERLVKESESQPDAMGIGTGIKLEEAKKAIGGKSLPIREHRPSPRVVTGLERRSSGGGSKLHRSRGSRGRIHLGHRRMRLPRHSGGEHT